MEADVSEKIVVPEGMLKAALDAEIKLHQTWGPVPRDPWHRTRAAIIDTYLEAALLWWSESLFILPTEEQYNQLRDKLFADCAQRGEKPYIVYWRFCGMLKEWQSRMFLASKPEIPKEVKDLLMEVVTPGFGLEETSNKNVIEAYRRGQKSHLKSRDDHD